MTNIRTEAVAGTFYPKSAVELQKEVNTLLANAHTFSQSKPKAIIAPHAGYIYSGAIAANAYKTIAAYAELINRVVLLGPSHQVSFRGLAYCSADYYRTPLGNIELDHSAIESIKHLPNVIKLDAAHKDEHSLEVQLPFLQCVLKQFALVPIVVGDANPTDVGQLIETLWGGDETLFVISSDLSHFLTYEQANQLDRQTCDAITAFRYNDIAHGDACGRAPLSGLLKMAEHHHLKISTVDLRNSGDTAGSKDRVVGYGAWILEQI